MEINLYFVIYTVNVPIIILIYILHVFFFFSHECEDGDWALNF